MYRDLNGMNGGPESEKLIKHF